jgi:hypothetical protein
VAWRPIANNREFGCHVGEVADMSFSFTSQSHGGRIAAMPPDQICLQRAAMPPTESESPWENGYVESFNGKLWDECLNGELFLNRTETQCVVDRWRLDYNHHRPHSSLGHVPPAEFARQMDQRWGEVHS